MTKLKFLEKLVKWSRKKYRKEHLNKKYNDIKCPYCNEWFSLSGIYYKHEYDGDVDFGCSVICGQCNHQSYWNLVACPLPIRCDNKGNPL